MERPEIVWLPCSVEEGMFTGEYAVQIDTGETSVSLFADESLIVTKYDGTYLKVTFLGDNGKPGYKCVLLPSESFETGSRWLSVPENFLYAEK